jgi:hypothetical protein
MYAGMVMTDEILIYLARHPDGVPLGTVLDHFTKKVDPARTNLPEVSGAIMELLNRDSIELDSVRYLKVVEKEEWVPAPDLSYHCPHGDRIDRATTIFAGPIYTCACCGITYGDLNPERADKLCWFCHEKECGPIL